MTTNDVAPKKASLADWLAKLETLSPREIVLGLERVQEVLARLALRRPLRILSVAGTNGKGSTVEMLAALYTVAGHQVATYTSPHVVHFNERMRVAGDCLSDAEIVSAFECVEAVRGGIPLTYFEFGTVAALVAFSRTAADVYVLEVGLGGRLDAVNAVDPDGSIICNVALDHCDWLGPDIESIAREKAGVMRRAVPTVFGAVPAPQAILDAARASRADLLLADRDFRAVSDRPSAKTWRFSFRDESEIELHEPALTGRFQLQNAACALALYFVLEGPRTLNAGLINAALSSVRLAGRMQYINTDRQWLLDVAHNPAAAAALAEELVQTPRRGRLLVVIGVLADKDLDALVKPLLPLVDGWIAVTAQARRVLPATQLAARLAELAQRPCRIAEDIGEALKIAAGLAGKDDLILVTGSFYTVGPALEELAHAAGSSLGYTRGAVRQRNSGS